MPAGRIEKYGNQNISSTTFTIVTTWAVPGSHPDTEYTSQGIKATQAGSHTIEWQVSRTVGSNEDSADLAIYINGVSRDTASLGDEISTSSVQTFTYTLAVDDLLTLRIRKGSAGDTTSVITPTNTYVQITPDNTDHVGDVSRATTVGRDGSVSKQGVMSAAAGLVAGLSSAVVKTRFLVAQEQFVEASMSATVFHVVGAEGLLPVGAEASATAVAGTNPVDAVAASTVAIVAAIGRVGYEHVAHEILAAPTADVTASSTVDSAVQVFVVGLVAGLNGVRSVGAVQGVSVARPAVMSHRQFLAGSLQVSVARNPQGRTIPQIDLRRVFRIEGESRVVRVRGRVGRY